MKRLVLELILQPLPIGDVAEVQHHASNRRLVQQVLPDRLNPSPRAVRVSNPHLRRLRRTVDREEPLQHRIHEPSVVQVDLPLEQEADTCRRVMSQDATDGVRFVRDLTAWPKDRDDVRGVLDERTEARLALAQIAGHRVQLHVELGQRPVLDAQAS